MRPDKEPFKFVELFEAQILMSLSIAGIFYSKNVKNNS